MTNSTLTPTKGQDEASGETVIVVVTVVMLIVLMISAYVVFTLWKRRPATQVARERTIELPSAALMDTEVGEDATGACGCAADMAPVPTQGPRCSVSRKGLRPGHLLFSGRFDNGDAEKLIRGTHAEMVKRHPDIPAYIVTAKGGQQFGEQTIRGVTGMHAMIAFCGSKYGEKTGSRYSTYFELKHAYEKDIPILPVKLCKEWPPSGGNEEGRMQNEFVFKDDLIYVDMFGKDYDPVTLADTLAGAYKDMLA